MQFNASPDACLSDVLIELTEPLRVLSAPVTGTAASGVCLALVVAALVYMCYRKRVIITFLLQVLFVQKKKIIGYVSYYCTVY